MKLTTPTFTPLLLVALGLAGNVLLACAQDSGSFDRPRSLAPADASSSGGGAAGGDEAAELAKKLANPIAALISVPLQNNFDWGSGPTGDGYKFTLNLQPVIPVSIGKDWNLILRTILPFISQHDVYYREVPPFPGVPDKILKEYPPEARAAVEEQGRRLYEAEIKKHPQDRSQDGLGDTLQSFFFSPKAPTGNGWIWGAGPVFLLPTATHDLLGAEKWGAGPTAVVLKQEKGWTYGALANHIWSFEGENRRQNVNATFLQPFVSFTTKKRTTFTANTETTYDWENEQWTVPLNLMVAQLVKVGKLPVQFQVGGRYYAERAKDGPNWGLRCSVTFLFPQ